MRLRTLTLTGLSVGLSLLGYQFSQLRANQAGAMPGVLADASEESNRLAAASAAANNYSASGNYRLSALSVFSNVALHVKDHYVEPKRVKPKDMLRASLKEVEQRIAEVLVKDLGDGRLSIRVLDQEKTIQNDVENLWEINLKLRDVFRFLEKHIPPQNDLRSVEYAAVNGALSTLDPHSVLLKPEAFAEMKTSTKGEFGGLGIVISVREAKLTVISPIDGTPAARAGLKAGDVISRIGDVSTVSMPIEEAVQLLRGPKGSKVTIWVDRKEWAESKKFSIIRERIKIESVEGELLDDGVGYIKIKNFQQNTGKDLEDHLDKLSKKAGGKLKGLVLDLRNNPGGLLEQAIRVSDKFVSSGDIVTTVGYGHKLREPKRARWSGTESDLAIAVLVNRGSASASEIVAGALKNLDRAVIIGERTFGKGSVQVLYDFADNSALKLTIAQYLTPGGISIQNEGVTPDIALKPAWLEENNARLFYEIEGHREASLDKHLERAGEKQVDKTVAFRMTYLVESKKKDKKKDKVDAFNEDYPISFARHFLLSSGSSERGEMISKSKSFVSRRQLQEEEKISARLNELKVDWAKSAGKADLGALQASLQLKEQPGKNATISPGETVKLVASVKNSGSQTIHRLRGELKSEHPAFKGREFMFGRIEPGKSAEWVVSAKIPKEASSRSDILSLRLTSAAGKHSEGASLAVVTKYIPHPQLGFSYVFDDSERGDGDGVLEVGEGVDFVVLVSNTGPGDADDVSLRLKSAAKEDLFLERGRVRIGPIKSGETRSGKLRFRVPKQQSGAGKLPLELTIYDSGTGEWLEEQFDLVAAKPIKHKASKASGLAQLKTNSTIFAQASGQLSPLGTISKGSKAKVLAKTKTMVKVEAADGAPVWLERKDVGLSRKSAAKLGEQKGIVLRPDVRPPTIHLSEGFGGRVVTTNQLKLSGKVTARSLRDMYVLLNNDKIHFQSAAKTPQELSKAAGKSSKQAAVADDAVQLPFEVELELKEGINKILVVARLNEKVVSYRRLFISRSSGAGQAVAEGPSVEKKKAAPGKP